MHPSLLKDGKSCVSVAIGLIAKYYSIVVVFSGSRREELLKEPFIYFGTLHCPTSQKRTRLLHGNCRNERNLRAAL